MPAYDYKEQNKNTRGIKNMIINTIIQILVLGQFALIPMLLIWGVFEGIKAIKESMTA